MNSLYLVKERSHVECLWHNRTVVSEEFVNHLWKEGRERGGWREGRNGGREAEKGGGERKGNKEGREKEGEKSREMN